MIDVPKVTQGVDSMAAAGAAQESEDIKKEQKKAAKVAETDKGLGLEDIPETSAPDIEHAAEAEEVEETAEVEEAEAADTLEQIDQELEKLQGEIKDVIARKVKLADKHDEKKHELLVSAFKDLKQAYVKIHDIREMIS